MEHTSTLAVRALLFRLSIIAIFIVFVARLWMLQIVEGEDYRLRADTNRFRVVDLPGPRGVLYDRNLNLLARNRPSFSIAVVPADLPADTEERAEVITRLLEALEEYDPIPGHELGEEEASALPGPGAAEPPEFRLRLTAEEIEEKVSAAHLGSAFRPIVVANRVEQDTAFILAEKSFELQGVQITINPIREYVTGPLTSHILGYTGAIPAHRTNEYMERGYNPNATVGLAGLEHSFEADLRGRPGRRIIEVDVNGREKRTVGDVIAPEPGNNLQLTIDIELQAAMEGIMERTMAGGPLRRSSVAIATNPKTGEVLGMVSLPAYDNNLFAKGISAADYRMLLEDPGRPLINYAVSGLYPPGSTYKIVPAAGGLQAGVITRNTIIRDDGPLLLPNRFFPDDLSMARPFVSWNHRLGFNHGPLNVVRALQVSNNIFFYTVGGGFRDFEGLGRRRLAEYSELFGMGSPTGIDLPGESPGLVPTAQWRRLNFAESWTTGHTYNMSIGQGDLLVTPLQMLNATVAIANGGFLYRPQLVYQVLNSEGRVVRGFEPDLIRQLPIDPAHINAVREGMWMVVNQQGGTATTVALPEVAVAGKTGTASFFDPDVPLTPQGNLPNHAWFSAFAPYEDPEIALVVFVFNGGEGSTTAAPPAREILEAYFNLQAGLNADGTPREPLLEEESEGGEVGQEEHLEEQSDE